MAEIDPERTPPNFSKPFPRISKLFQGKSKVFPSFSKEFQIYSLAVFNEINDLAAKAADSALSSPLGANSPPLRTARAERPAPEALAGVRFQATTNSVFPEDKIAAVSNDHAEPPRRTCVSNGRNRPMAVDIGPKDASPKRPFNFTLRWRQCAQCRRSADDRRISEADDRRARPL